MLFERPTHKGKRQTAKRQQRQMKQIEKHKLKCNKKSSLTTLLLLFLLRVCVCGFFFFDNVPQKATKQLKNRQQQTTLAEPFGEPVWNKRRNRETETSCKNTKKIQKSTTHKKGKVKMATSSSSCKWRRLRRRLRRQAAADCVVLARYWNELEQRTCSRALNASPQRYVNLCKASCRGSNGNSSGSSSRSSSGSDVSSRSNVAVTVTAAAECKSNTHTHVHKLFSGMCYCKC